VQVTKFIYINFSVIGPLPPTRKALNFQSMKKQHKYSTVRPADTTPPPPLGWCYLTQHMNTQFHTILSVFYILSPIFYVHVTVHRDKSL